MWDAKPRQKRKRKGKKGGFRMFMALFFCLGRKISVRIFSFLAFCESVVFVYDAALRACKTLPADTTAAFDQSPFKFKYWYYVCHIRSTQLCIHILFILNSNKGYILKK